MKKLLTAIAVSGMLLLGACGGESQADRLAEVLQAEGGLTAKESECVADELVDSDVSEKTIDAIITNDQDYEPTEAETTKAIEALGTSFTTCDVDLTDVGEDAEGEPDPAEPSESVAPEDDQ